MALLPAPERLDSAFQTALAALLAGFELLHRRTELANITSCRELVGEAVELEIDADGDAEQQTNQTGCVCEHVGFGA